MATDTLEERLLDLAGNADCLSESAWRGMTLVALRDAASTLTSQAQQIAQLRELLKSQQEGPRYESCDDPRHRYCDQCGTPEGSGHYDSCKWFSAESALSALPARPTPEINLSDVCIVVAGADFSCERRAQGCTVHPRQGEAPSQPAYGRQSCGCFVDSSGVTSILCAQHRPRWQSPIPGKGEGESLQARAEALWIKIRPPRDRRSAQWLAFDDKAVEQIMVALRQERHR